MADTPKHTPGPWRREGLSGDDLRIIDANGLSLFGNEAYYPWCSENPADWDLIAAAPDMLEALKYCLNCFDRESCDPMVTLDPVQAIAFAKAAISKAEGR